MQEEKSLELKVSESTLSNVSSEYIRYMIYLFEETSKKVFPKEINVPNEGWFDYIDSIYKICGQDIPKKVIINNLPEIHIDGDSLDKRGVMVGISGGSDSTTYACYFMDKGYHVVLYSLFNVNRGIRSENKVVENFAKHFGLELDYDKFNFKGRTSYAESPIKNHLIATYMIPHMVDRGIVNMSEGLFSDDTTTNIHLTTYSDYYDIFRLFEKAIQYTFPQFRFKVVFKSTTHRAAYLVKYHKDIIPLYQTCISQDFLRKRLREKVESKYHLNSPENRCMSCRKCALDYLLLGIFGYLKINKQYVLENVKKLFLKYHNCPTEGKEADEEYKKIIKEFIDFGDYERYHSNPSAIDEDIEKVFKIHNRE